MRLRKLTDAVSALGTGRRLIASVATIGVVLFRDYAFAFEVTSILILVAMVGAVVLARKEQA